MEEMEEGNMQEQPEYYTVKEYTIVRRTKMLLPKWEPMETLNKKTGNWKYRKIKKIMEIENQPGKEVSDNLLYCEKVTVSADQLDRYVEKNENT